MKSISTSNVSLDAVSGQPHIQVSRLKKPTLRQGATHPDVVELQQLLSRYVSPRVSSGVFDDATDYAVRLFQYRMFLIEDGIVGSLTWLALYTGAPVNMPVLRRTATGEAVKQIQSTLLIAGFEAGPVDGYFGRVTQNAVAAFQRQMGIMDDGIVGPSAWHALSKVRLEDPISPITAFTLRQDHKLHALEITDIAVASRRADWTLATASRDTSIRFWNVDGAPTDTIYVGDRGAVSSVAFHPTKPQLISATFGGTVRIANYAANSTDVKTIGIFPARGGSITDVDIDPTGRYICATTALNAARIFNFEGDVIRELFDASDSTHHGLAESIAFSPRGNQLATASNNGGALLWNNPLDSGIQGINLSSSRFADVVVFSPHGYKLAVARGPLLQIYANRRLVLATHQFSDAITSLAFNPSGRYLAVGSHSGKIYIFDLQANSGAGEVVFELSAHSAAVTAVAFGAVPAAHLYSGDSSGRLISWTANRYSAEKQISYKGKLSPVGWPSPF